MKKIFTFTAALAIVLVFAFTVIGCPQPTSGSGAETWKDITSLSQVNGTWKATTIETHTTSWSNVNERVVNETTLTINASAGTGSNSTKYTYTYSGSGLSANWDEIKEHVTEMATYNSTTAIFDGTAHTATYTVTYPPQSIFLSDFTEFKISQDGTKMRFPQGLIFSKQ